MLFRPFALLILLLLPTRLEASSVIIEHVPADAVIDVTKAPYNAIPNDNQDDSDAIQRAITDHAGTGRTIYLPRGVYDVSKSLEVRGKDGHFTFKLTLRGQPHGLTVLRLADKAPGFGDPKNPKAVYATGSLWSEGDVEDGGGNKAFCNNVFDLGINTGEGNPGAIGIEWANSNQGSIRGVKIESGDGQGFAGIAMLRKIPGPGLVTSTEISGFDTGIIIGDIQYGFTLDKVDIQAAKTALLVRKNLVYVRGLDAMAPIAIRTEGRESFLILTDSSTKSDVQAGGHSFWNGVESGTGHWQMTATNYPTTKEIGKRGARPLKLPIEEAPIWINSDSADFQAVGPRLDGEIDDTAAIQRAIDSGKSTIYFINDRVYFASDTIIVRGKVRQIIGFGSELNLGAAQEPFNNRENPRPLFRIGSTESKVVQIENMYFNTQYQGVVVFEQNSPETLVIRNCIGWVGGEGMRRSYRNSDAARGGKLFIEDVFMPGWSFRGMQVWARQFNPEDPEGTGEVPQVINENGDLWILGFKTEGPAPFIVTHGKDARTVLLGAYNYVSAASPTPLPKNSVPYIIEDGASADLSFVTENFREGDDEYTVYIRDNGKDVLPADLPKRWDGVNPKSYAMPIYHARP